MKTNFISKRVLGFWLQLERQGKVSGSTGDRGLQLAFSLLIAFFLPLPVQAAACGRRRIWLDDSSSGTVCSPSLPLLALSAGCSRSWGKWKRKKVEVLDL